MTNQPTLSLNALLDQAAFALEKAPGVTVARQSGDLVVTAGGRAAHD